jgi:hypothetical protein
MDETEDQRSVFLILNPELEEEQGLSENLP